ncbi:TapY2 family type IVa secretion system protein [Catenovulum sp. 2E275]|uniref:TapY2 family type IVa secretion system protein n=1 Tax=Catenovulum sp. 2E275 TaxID=2980497 RepID=UPI0021D3D5B8|nr:TapY2 family type IVa secretion system protein [Catenovulum sp. 2E275]MCU4676277.1 TapY2 family type IVa secretion system protein [Catenovulum sp. 2E275]
MKLIHWLIASICLSWSIQPSWADEYKCYVELANQQNKIVLLKVKPNSTVEQAKQTMLNQGIFAPDGKQKLMVSKIAECVLFNRQFQSDQARQLDNNTPF